MPLRPNNRPDAGLAFGLACAKTSASSLLIRKINAGILENQNFNVLEGVSSVGTGDAAAGFAAAVQGIAGAVAREEDNIKIGTAIDGIVA